jgi:predicted glycosyltransferase
LKYVFYLGHPAHFHLFKHVIRELGERHRVRVLCRAKDVLVQLLRDAGWEHENVQPGGRGVGPGAITWGLLKREWRLLRTCVRDRPDALVGCSPELAHVGWLLRIRSIITVEDDFDVIPKFARLTYPFCSVIAAPVGCDVGPYEAKTQAYQGYHELAYLHPRRFSPEFDKTVSLRRGGDVYSIVRLSRLTAHHDRGIRGMEDGDVDAIVDRLSREGNVWISAERPVPERFAHMLLPIGPSDIHHALAYARVLVSDSQTMTMEAAVLGTPSVRCSDFVGRISVLEELESRYGLTIGVEPGDRSALLAAVGEILSPERRTDEWIGRRRRMLDDKVDVSTFLIRLLENPPA